MRTSTRASAGEHEMLTPWHDIAHHPGAILKMGFIFAHTIPATAWRPAHGPETPRYAFRPPASPLPWFFDDCFSLRVSLRTSRYQPGIGASVEAVNDNKGRLFCQGRPRALMGWPVKDRLQL